MKTALNLLVLAFLILAAPSPCFAMRDISVVSKQDAKEMGIEIRATGNGPQVWVELEFKAEGKLKAFKHVELEMSEGGKFLVGYAALKETRSASGAIAVRFLADRAQLEKIALCIVVGDFEDGFEVPLKNFADLAKAR